MSKIGEVSAGRALPGVDLEALLSRFSAVRVAVVGDLMLDHFVYGTVERISPEAPVPVVDVEREVYLLGGAANVVHNLRALGAQVDLVGGVGADTMAEMLRAELEALGVSCDGLAEFADRPTALKTRVIAQHQQVVRFDREKKGPPPEAAVAVMSAHLSRVLPNLDAVLVSDYGKGVVSAAFMERLLGSARRHGVPVFLDPKPENAGAYAGVDVITPNVKEAEALAGCRARTDHEAAAAGRALIDRFGSRAILLTRGERGMTLVEGGGDVTHIPTVARDVFDVTGAGDTAISALTLAWAAGCDPKEAARLANLAAGIVVGKVGTATVGSDELARAAEGMRSSGG